jgi:hypothetical protein
MLRWHHVLVYIIRLPCSRDAGGKGASRWVSEMSEISAKVSVKVSSARILLFLSRQEFDSVLPKKSELEGSKASRP